MTDQKFCPVMFPNVNKILKLLLLVSTTASANSSLRYVKNKMRSTMGQDRFNALMLLFVHKDIKVDFDTVIQRYATRHPRKMLLMNPLSLSV